MLLMLTTVLRFNPQISACDWPDAVECRGEREAITLVSGAKMVWQREEPRPASTTTEKAVSNIPELPPSLDSTRLISSSNKEIPVNNQIQESGKKILNVADVVARVKGKLLPAFRRGGEATPLAKNLPAKAVLVQTFRPASELRVNVLEAERNKYPRAANIV